MKWHQELCEQNPQYKAFEGQGVWLVRDDTCTLEVMEKHAVVEQNTALLNSFYQQLVVKG
ncbi:1756_t:CDS:1, partial [Entrophospora sp. SA101]